MSKGLRIVALLTAAGLQILQLLTTASAQYIEASIVITSGDTPTAAVSGTFLDERLKHRNLSFLSEYAGVSGLGERISNVQLMGRGRRLITAKRFNSAEYVADSDIASWNYTVDLRPLSERSAFAHASWVSGDTGILMLGDLLPAGVIGSHITTKAPQGWQQIFKGGVPNTSDQVMLIGNAWRVRPENRGKPFATAISGEWHFSDDEFAAQVAEIFRAYDRMFGTDFLKKAATTGSIAQVVLTRFPASVPWDQWEADTRGRTVVIVSSDTPFKSQSAQRLHEQLRHELFHLWMPGRLGFTGHFDWFYEGFALYQSLKLGVGVGRIRFEDMLGTLAQAIDNDRSIASKVSLIDASKQRWTVGNNSLVYNRGLLVAFLSDLALLERSNGKVSTDTLVREIYEKANEGDGNEAIVRLMRRHTELSPIIDQYVLGTAAIDWTNALKQSGLQAAAENDRAKLSIVAKPSAKQKALLRKLGYNSWLD